ncbi:MAG: chemotaxis protein CheV [Synergistaceae bacterium]|nr:chemotaxis protein [Synergistota bacterium]NLM71591.1 chemotaxis protein CheV [Synergistaceae bacterium]
MQEVKKVITEVGTNEWQVVVFFLGDQTFAINVDKTREILRWPGCRTIPESHPSMIGITSVRGEVLPLLDLRLHLGIEPKSELESSNVVIAEFNEIKLGFVVDAVERIYRINSEELDSTLTGTFLGEHVLYVIKRDERNVLLLDYEAIVQMVNPVLSQRYQIDVEKTMEMTAHLGDLNRFRILVAEDSPLIRKQISDVLEQGGFHNLVLTGDGKEAWDQLNTPGEHFDLLITDVEMPMMDGLALTRRVKEHPDLKKVPIVVFSSIMAQDIKVKAASVGAEAQITKPEIPDMLEHIIRLLPAGK